MSGWSGDLVRASRCKTVMPGWSGKLASASGTCAVATRLTYGIHVVSGLRLRFG